MRPGVISVGFPTKLLDGLNSIEANWAVFVKRDLDRARGLLEFMLWSM